MKERFFGCEKEIMMETHSLNISDNGEDWICGSCEDGSYCSMPTYAKGNRTQFTLIYTETFDEDGLIHIEEYLLNEHFGKGY